MPADIYSENALTIEIVDTPGEVHVIWRGGSMDREPGRFILPILHRAIEKGGRGERRIVMDFRGMDYMNSSSFTPLVKILAEAGSNSHRVLVVFDRQKKWQELNFRALKVFETKDGRVAFRGG